MKDMKKRLAENKLEPGGFKNNHLIITTAKIRNYNRDFLGSALQGLGRQCGFPSSPRGVLIPNLGFRGPNLIRR